MRALTNTLLMGTALSLALGCSTTTGVVKKKKDDDPTKTTAKKKKEEDLSVVRDVAEVKAPVYVPGVEKKAQDEFRRGVQHVHEVPPKFDEALEHFEKAITIEPDFLEPYFNIAMVYEATRRPEKALETYQRALKANPESADAKAFIGKIYLAKARDEMDAGNTSEAEQLMSRGKALFDEVLGKDYENVPANNALALFWLLKGNADKAEEHVKQVLVVDPQNVTALNTRGLIYLQAGKLYIAQWIFEQKVLQLNRNSVEAMTNLGTVYVRLNELPKAVGYFQSAVRLDKNNVSARMNLGAIYLNFLNYKAAKEEYDAVLKIQPKNVEAIIGQSSSVLGLGGQTGDSEKALAEAIEGYEKALKLDKRRVILLKKIAELLEKKYATDEKGMQRAISYYERYLRQANLPPTDDVARRVVALKDMIKQGMLKAPKPDADDPLKKKLRKKAPGTPSGETPKADAPKADPPAGEKPKADAPKADPPAGEKPKAGGDKEGTLQS